MFSFTGAGWGRLVCELSCFTKYSTQHENILLANFQILDVQKVRIHISWKMNNIAMLIDEDLCYSSTIILKSTYQRMDALK